LLSLVTAEPREHQHPTRAQLTVTTYELDDTTFGQVESGWAAWWSKLNHGPDRP
jgi:hypothetical protein